MPDNLEIERKYLIEIPDIAVLKSQPGYDASYIEQMYISADGSGEYKGDRIRKRQYQNITKYYQTHKQYLKGFTKIEIEKEISADEYQKLAAMKLPDSSVIQKVRHCFEYKGQLIELDVYEFWNDKATAEVELESEEQAVELPDFIRVIEDVTHDRSYSNNALSFDYLK